MYDRKQSRGSLIIRKTTIIINPERSLRQKLVFCGQDQRQSFRLVPEKRIKKQTNRKPHESVSCSDINDDPGSFLVLCVLFVVLAKLMYLMVVAGNRIEQEGILRDSELV